MEALGAAGRRTGDHLTTEEAAEPTDAPPANRTDLRWASGATARERLFADASLFSFYQAVKVLSLLQGNPESSIRHHSVPARFRSRMGFDFPGADIHQFHPAIQNAGTDALPVMVINFLGLAGAHGPLPSVYTEQLLRETTSALRDFLDIFNHRLILLLYRVHEMHHPELTPSSPDQGLAANHLYAFFGLGRDPGSSARNRQTVPDRALLDYSGLLAHRPHSASGLKRLLADYFQVDVAVEQFVGAWLDLSEDQWTHIGAHRGRNHQLGDGAILGKRVWDQHTGVTVRLGPLDLDTFESFLPNGAAYKPLCDLCRFYLGTEIDFSFKLELRTDQIPWAEPLAAGPLPNDSRRPQLGRLAWLRTPGPSGQDETGIQLHDPVPAGEEG
jgi:type VI secretion system protein ImpH